MTILGSGQPPLLERPDQSTLGVNRSLCRQLVLLISRGGGRRYFEFFEEGVRAPTLLPREQKIKEVFEQIPWGRSTDARKAIGAYNTGWYVRRLIARCLMRRIGRDKYELTRPSGTLRDRIGVALVYHAAMMIN